MENRLKLSIYTFVFWILFTFLLMSFNLWEINPLKWTEKNIEFFCVIGIATGAIISLSLYFDTNSDGNNLGI